MPPELLALIRASGLDAASFGVQVQAVDERAKPWASFNAETDFALASTAKLVTTLCALDLLGPHYRWATRAYAQGPLRQGRLLGDLHVVGGGDVRLSSDDLLRWFARLREQGVADVWGDIVLDGRAFALHEADHVHTPSPAPERLHHQRPHALMLNEGLLRLELQSGKGQTPEVSWTPPLAGLRVVGQFGSKTLPGPDCTASVEPDLLSLAPTLKVKAQWGPACGLREWTLAPMAHDDYAELAVADLWRLAGGRLRGRVRTHRAITAGPGSEARADDADRKALSEHFSPPLSALVHDIHKHSDNLAARHLMLSLAPGFPQRSATLAQARLRVQAWLVRQGLSNGDIEVESGSGLSRQERGKPRALVHLLRQAARAPGGEAFIQSLPQAGVDGTLAQRFTQGPATGRAWLKTGSLNDVRALAGYVRSGSDKWLAVALLVNHGNTGDATQTLDALVQEIARQAS